MSISVELCLLAVAVLLCFDILLVCRVIINRLKKAQLQEDNRKQKSVFLQAITDVTTNVKVKLSITDYFKLKQSVQLDINRQEHVKHHIDMLKYEKRQIRRITSVFPHRRMEAAVHLGLLASDNCRLALEKAILLEKNYPVRLYMANALADIAKPESIPVLAESLINSHRWYRDKINLFLADFGEAFHLYLPQIIGNSRIEMKELIVDFASVYFSETLRSYLINLIDSAAAVTEQFPLLFGENGVKCCANCIHGSTVLSSKRRQCPFKGEVRPDYKCNKYQLLPVSVNAPENYHRLVYKAAAVLGRYYPSVLADNKYLHAADTELQNIAIDALAHFPTEASINKLLPYLSQEDSARTAVHAISKIIFSNPEHMNTVVDLFNLEQDMQIKPRMAEILAGKIEYFIMKLASKNSKTAADIIKQILVLNRSSEVIDFLNKNKDIDIENGLVAVIKDLMPLSVELETAFGTYLNERLLHKLGLNRCELIVSKRDNLKDLQLIRRLYVLMIAIFAVFPIIYCIRHYAILFEAPLMQQISLFVLDFNYYLSRRQTLND